MQAAIREGEGGEGEGGALYDTYDVYDGPVSSSASLRCDVWCDVLTIPVIEVKGDPTVIFDKYTCRVRIPPPFVILPRDPL
jgi:hypothetical protein